MWVDHTCKQVFPELSARFALCRETTSLQAASGKRRFHAHHKQFPVCLVCHNFSAGGPVVSRKCGNRTRQRLQLWFVVDWTIGCRGRPVQEVHMFPFMPTLTSPGRSVKCCYSFVQVGSCKLRPLHVSIPFKSISSPPLGRRRSLRMKVCRFDLYPVQ